MKVLLMSMNSKFIHSNLALYYLKEFAESRKELYPNISLYTKEYTINMNLDDVLASIVKGGYDVIFASTYIWNVEPFQILFTNLKLLFPEIKIVYGGPEVTYNPKEQLKQNDFLDAVIVGEGEMTFLETLSQCSKEQNVDFGGIDGVVYKTADQIIIANSPRMPMNPLDVVPFPYPDLKETAHKILYYETTRGCPFNCSYCLSSANRGVRYFSHDKIFGDLKRFLEAKVPQVKFVDRTFNVSQNHALPILEFLIANDNGVTNFHFEVTADLLDEAYLEVIARSRKGLFQFEIGIQSTCDAALKAINRPMSFEKVKSNTQKLIALNKAHTHVDLIAGLPFEGYDRFLQSFDEVFEIGADHVQMGFLKVLKGTPLSKEIETHGYKVRVQSPYEILENKYITYEEISRLKKIENLLEHYWNSEKFTYSMKYLLTQSHQNPSAFFETMSLYWDAHDYFESAMGAFRLYEILQDFVNVNDYNAELFNDLLKVDFYKSKQKGIKDLFHYDEDEKFNSKRLLLLNQDHFIKENLPQYEGTSAKQILKHLAFVSTRYNIEQCVLSQYLVEEKGKYVLIIDQESSDASLELIQVPMAIWEDM